MRTTLECMPMEVNPPLEVLLCEGSQEMVLNVAVVEWCVGGFGESHSLLRVRRGGVGQSRRRRVVLDAAEGREKGGRSPPVKADIADFIHRANTQPLC